MRKLLLLLSLLPCAAMAIEWSGDTSNFKFSGDTATLDLDEKARSVLYRESKAAIDLSFSFGAGMSKAPSSQNCIRFYPIASSAVLDSADKACYVEMGGAGKTISLYRQSGTRRTLIAAAAEDLLAENYSSFYIMGERGADYLWRIYAKFPGTEEAELLIEAADSTVRTSAYCGFLIKNTKTRGRGFSVYGLEIEGREGTELPEEEPEEGGEGEDEESEDDEEEEGGDDSGEEYSGPLPEAPGEDRAWVSPEAFTPDGDGIDDKALICFRELADTPVSIGIYTADGLPVRSLAAGEIVGSEGCRSWDGTDDDGRACPAGIYVALFEAYGSDGYALRLKIPFVLSLRR